MHNIIRPYLLYLTVVLTPIKALAEFDVLVIGAHGGINDGDATAFLISPQGDPRGIMCDAGTLVKGIEVAVNAGNTDYLHSKSEHALNAIGDILTKSIQGYLISHAHLDHISGLVFASPDDSAKPIYASKATISQLKTHLFNWQLWPNFTDQGVQPHLNKYHYAELKFGHSMPMPNTEMSVTAYPLSHNQASSTAFLIENKQQAILCMGDTGPDEIEQSDKLKRLWQAMAPLVRQGKLKGIIIESSYTNSRPDQRLYGHLTPKWITHELGQLAAEVGDVRTLSQLTIIISHIKYSLQKEQAPQMTIQHQLEADNALKLHFVIPRQGQRIQL